MPRGTMDQALVTGLSAAANHALIGLVQESIQAAALVVSGQGRHAPLDDRRGAGRRSRPMSAAIGLGLACAARPAVSNTASRSPAPAAAPAGFWLAVDRHGRRARGPAPRGRRRPERPRPFVRGERGGREPRSPARTRGSCAGARASTPICRPRRPRRRSRSRSGSGSASSRACRRSAPAERALADRRVPRASRACFPGDAALWRPVGHAAALAGFGAAARYIAVDGAAPDRERPGVGAGRVRHRAAEPVGERELREPRSVRHAVAGRRALRLDDDRPRDAGRGDGRARRAPMPIRAYVGPRERADRAGARRPAHARARTHQRVRSLVAHGRVTDGNRLRELRGRVDPRVPDPRRLRDDGDAVLGPAVAALARPGERGPQAHADARGRAPRPARAVPARSGGRRSCCSARASARGPARTRSSDRARRVSSTRASTSRSGSARRTSASGRSACSTTIAPTSTAA